MALDLRRDGTRAWWTAGRMAVVAASVAAYAAAVSGVVQRGNLAADLRGCIELHAVVYQVLLLAGTAAGLAAGPMAVWWARAAARSLLPNGTEGRRTAWVRGAALAVIGLGLAANALWTSPSVNLFVDTHRPILVEADLLLYGMGALAGAAWYALLDEQGWIGALASPAMAFTLVSAGFTGAGWCG